MGLFLPESALPGLKEYKYSSIDRSLISRFILKPFYAKFVLLFPKWVAPNLITLTGLGFTAFGVLTVLYYNPYFDAECPSWVYWSLGLEMFLYQTFDACDGLQARRTGSSSPLGELFDHTVDAINTTLGVIMFAGVVNFKPWMILTAQVATLTNFYLSTWEEFHTKTLFLSIFSGPVEGVLMIVAIDFLTGVIGPSYYNQPLIFGFTPNELYMPGFAGALFFNIASAVYNVSKVVKTSEQRRAALRGLIPFAVLWTGMLVWINAAPFLVHEALVPLILTAGTASAMQVGRIITAHVTHQPSFPLWDPVTFLPWVAAGVHYVLQPLFGWPLQTVDISMLWLNLGVSVGIYGCFVAEIINEITSYLGINTLTIKPKND